MTNTNTNETDILAFEPIRIWGLPLAPLTTPQVYEAVDRMVELGKPGYFITANLHYAMLTDREPRLNAVNDKAAFILADGMPMVWASRFRKRRLPERVAGSDLVPALSQRASQRGWGVFLLGAEPAMLAAASKILTERFPGLKIVGAESPPFRPLTPDEHRELLERIRTAAPKILFVAFGQPKGELWIYDNLEQLGVPVCVQVGASLDFVAGKVHRAPRWMQRCGLEWFYRMISEPRRLAPRYWNNGKFLIKALIRDLFGRGK